MEDPTPEQRISECGKELAIATVPAFTSSEGVHIPTMIAACARMAGTYLFRSLPINVGAAAPGEAVLSVEATEASPLLLRTCAGILKSLGTTIAREPSEPLGGEKNRPQKTFLETQAILDSLYAPAKAKFSLSDRQMAQAAAVATGVLVHHFAKYVEPNRGFGIAAVAFAEGSQTVPAPLPTSCTGDVLYKLY
jgi:hypothetical protein